MTSFLNLVKCSTVKTDIPVPPGLDPDPTQFSKGLDKTRIKGFRVQGPRVDCAFGSCVREENLVRGEQSLPLLQILKIGIVEGFGRGGVHVDGYPGVHISRAHVLELGRVLPVQGRVDRVGAVEIVDPV